MNYELSRISNVAIAHRCPSSMDSNYVERLVIFTHLSIIYLYINICFQLGRYILLLTLYGSSSTTKYFEYIIIFINIILIGVSNAAEAVRTKLLHFKILFFFI